MKLYRKVFILIAVIFFLLLYSIIKAKEKWTVIKETDGLPNKFVKCITVDGNFIWIGTANGIAIYDSTKSKIIKTLSTKDGLIDNFITAIEIDGDLVWIATSSGISVYNKKSSKFERKYTKGTGLSDNYITDLVITENYVWASTKFWGIDRMDKTTGNWRNFSVLHGLADNSVNCIKPDGLLLWAGTKKGLSYYDEFSGMWITYDQTQGLVDPNILSIAVDGSYLWCGTPSGIAKFDKYSESFKIITTADGLIDDFVQSLKLDGIFLWAGTFSGVSKYDKKNNKWLNYTTQDGLSENSISCIEIDGNYVLFGTDGGGVSIFNKEYPQAFISPLSYYKQPGEIAILGTVYDYEGIDSIKLSFTRGGMKEYISTGIKISGEKNIKNSVIAEWNVKNLPNFEHILKLEVINKKGLKNEFYAPFIIDTREPEFTLQEIPESVKESPIYISGTFLEDNLVKILIQPGNILADLNRLTRKYTAEVPLKKGINDIKITAYDIANQTAYLERRIIYDTDSPEIIFEKYPEKISTPEFEIKGICRDSSLQRIILNPGNIEVPFKIQNIGEYSFSVKPKLDVGENNLQFTAYDYVGNKTTKYAKIIYESTLPTIKIDKSITKVNKPEFEIKGEWIDDNIDYIFIEPDNKRASIDFKNRTFSLKTKLKEGENLITATIIDKDGNKGVDVHSVIYSTAKSLLEITSLPEYTFERQPTITGKFNEPNLAKILLLPSDQEAMIDYKNNTFTIKLPELKYGENKFEIVMLDKLNNKVSKSFKIFFDDKPPLIEVSDLPKIINIPQLNIQGSYEDDYIDKIVIKPYNIPAKIDLKTKKFNQKIELKAGDNKIIITAIDKAGNITELEKIVSFVPQITTAVEEGVVDSEYVKKLKEEIERLKALLNQKAYYKPVEPETLVYIPKGNAFYFVPYKPEKGFSLINITEKYLGSLFYFNFITKINSSFIITENKKVLLPTKELIKNYTLIKDNKFHNIVDGIAISYNISKGSLTKFKNNFISFLIKYGYLPPSDVKIYAKNDIINIGDYVIFINKRTTKTTSKYISINLNNSFLKLEFPVEKILSRE